MRVLADSSAWLAVYDRRDPNNEAVVRLLSEWARLRATIFVTDYIFDESLTLILSRIGHTQAANFGRWLLGSQLIHMVRLDLPQWQAAWQLFQQYDDKDFSFTDCTSFVVMRDLHLVDAFTFDRHFEQMGFRMWPK
jgi:predicted nucleic acid-binding protein